jgi:hypothetical protein
MRGIIIIGSLFYNMCIMNNNYNFIYFKSYNFRIYFQKQIIKYEHFEISLSLRVTETIFNIFMRVILIFITDIINRRTSTVRN